ncbi:hypothetical protein ACWEDZ_02805 [Streptomyces sp. NPDC005047]
MPQQTPPRAPAEIRRLSNGLIRHAQRPRWVAYYEDAPGSTPLTGRRRVGLLVPRHKGHVLGRSQIAYAYDGTLMEFKIGYSAEGSHGEWYAAHANELPREQWQAIRNFWINLQAQ